MAWYGRWTEETGTQLCEAELEDEVYRCNVFLGDDVQIPKDVFESQWVEIMPEDVQQAKEIIEGDS